MTRGKPSSAVDFWSNVDAVSGCCWKWLGRAGCNGYGRASLQKTRLNSHVIAYRLTKGAIPSNQLVRHTCDNKLCCNPNHLILGSRADNVQDMVDRGRQARGEQRPHKLKEQQVIEIKTLIKSGVLLKTIATQFHVCPATISDIKNNRSWKHL